MRIIVSSNIPWNLFTAQICLENDYLTRYICAAGTRGKGPLWRLLPSYLRDKLISRDISTIPKDKTRTLWLPEVLQKGSLRLGLFSMERANQINNALYDRMAVRHVETCDIFHGSSGISLAVATHAKTLGALFVADEKTEHPDYQRRVLAEEYDRLGLPNNPPGRLYYDKLIAEYELADYIILPSEYARRTFIECGYDPAKVMAVPLGVDLDLFGLHTGRGTPPAAQDKPFRILFAGQIIPRKGVHYLLEAFSRFTARDAELHLVGRLDPTMKDIIERATQEDARVKLHGNVSKQKLNDLYNASSVFVLPSLADSWGLVTAEAMACGLPVIISENCGSQEMVREGIDGFVIPIRDAATLYERLDMLYTDTDLRTHMGNMAAQRAHEFTWSRYATRLLRVYHHIAARHGLPISQAHREIL